MRSSEERLTLAQFAARAGVSKGRVRALWAEGGRLPTEDGRDADDRPWWWASTVDRWCRRTGRPVAEEADSLYRWKSATEPAPVLHVGDVTVPGTGWGRPTRVHTTVYDTADGHVVWVQRYAGDDLNAEDAARAGALVLAPAWWWQARIIVPGNLPYFSTGGLPPWVEAFRLDPPEGAEDEIPRWLPSFLKVTSSRRSADTDAAETVDPQTVPIEPVGLPDVAELARILGRDLPLWFDGSCTPSTMQKFQLLGPGNRFTTADTTTQWPAHHDRIVAAHRWRLQEQFPQAWAALAADTLTVLRAVQSTHREIRTAGDGWYVPARPAEPQWPIDVETAARQAAGRDLDPAAAAAELAELRAVEAGRPWDEPLAVALWEALRSTAGRIHRSHPAEVFATVQRQVIEADGPVAKAYRDTLTPLAAEEDQALRAQPTRRLLRLLSFETDVLTVEQCGGADQLLREITGLNRDPAGRLVAERTLPAGRAGERVQLLIEWPTGMPAQDWTQDTVVAGERNAFALIPTPDGDLRVEPLPSCGGSTGYTWGYQGTGPTDLYRALVRGALRTWEDPATWLHQFRRGEATSALWEAITSTGQAQPLRLPWPQVTAWAAEDRARAHPEVKLIIERIHPPEIDSVRLAANEPVLLQIEQLLAAAGIESDRLYDEQHGLRDEQVYALELRRPHDQDAVAALLDTKGILYQHLDDDAE